MTWLTAPIGMTRHDELLNLLLALWLTGGAHEPTLDLIAQAYGLLDHFEQAKQRRVGKVTALLLEAP